MRKLFFKRYLNTLQPDFLADIIPALKWYKNRRPLQYKKKAVIIHHSLFYS